MSGGFRQTERYMSKPSPGFKAEEFSKSAELPEGYLSVEMRGKAPEFLPPQF
jgi:hypothetical protein